MDYEIVEKLMKEKGVRASDVAKATGIPSSVFTDWKKGRYVPKADKLYALARYFQIPMEAFFSADDSYVELLEKVLRNKQLLYEISAGNGRLNDGTPTEVIDEMSDDDESAWCKVCGDSMYPVLLDGDCVKIRLQTETSPTDLTAIKINGDEVTCKYVEVTENGVWLRAENTEAYKDRFYSVQEVLSLPVSIVGKVVELKRRF